jgi:hypothetical protein
MIDAIGAGWRALCCCTRLRGGIPTLNDKSIASSDEPFAFGSSVSRRGLLGLLFSSVAIAGFSPLRADRTAKPGVICATADNTIITIDQI